jgi:DNA-binding ferritin-like protein
MAKTKSDVAQALDQTLSDLITLDLAVRQARGNLGGALNVHRLLDGLADAARDAGNRIAARSMQLGHNPNLWAETTARKSALRLVDHQPLSDTGAYSAFEQILGTITARLFANIRASDCDLVTQSLLMDLAERLDNIAWTARARAAA